MSNFTNAEVIEYRGEKRHISILLKDNKRKYHVLYARTAELDIKDEKEYAEWSRSDHIDIYRAIANRNIEIIIQVLIHNNAFYHIIDIDKKEDFELVDKVVSTLLED